MQDKAQEISAVIWRWYKQLTEKDKGDHDWDMLLEAGKQVVNQYKDDEISYKLAQELFFVFADHAGRLERAKVGEWK